MKQRKLFAHWNLKYRRHACVNDCILYRGEYKDFRACPTCKHARYKHRRAKDKYKLDDDIKTGNLYKVEPNKEIKVEQIFPQVLSTTDTTLRTLNIRFT